MKCPICGSPVTKEPGTFDVIPSDEIDAKLFFKAVMFFCKPGNHWFYVSKRQLALIKK